MDSKISRFVTCMSLVGLSLVQPACDNSTEPVSPEVAGNYALVTANDQPLPYLLQETSTQTVTITAGTLQLRSDHGFNWSIRSEIVPSGGGDVDVAISENEGSFSVNGSSIEFRTATGGRIPGTISGQELTFSITGSEGGITFGWRKG